MILAVKQLKITELFDYFQRKRMNRLELLQLAGTGAIIDLGCMWGALSILWHGSQNVFAVDKTLDSLKFMAKRAQKKS